MFSAAGSRTATRIGLADSPLLAPVFKSA